jgi:Asp-tRNA(Asn)/Glu-tRNA(Gln) amidotransferase A subunit family amidase
MSGVALKGLKVGVLTAYVNHTIDETSIKVSTSFDNTLAMLKSEGVEIVYLDEPEFHPTKLSDAEIALYEFQSSINEYLSQIMPPCPKSLGQIISTNQTDLIALGPTFPISLTLSPTHPSYPLRLQKIQHLKLVLAKTFASNSLDALIFPHQTVLAVKVGEPVQRGRNGLLASLAGCPSIVIPMPGEGVPVGMEVFGMWGEDWRVLGIAWAMEKILRGRRVTAW